MIPTFGSSLYLPLLITTHITRGFALSTIFQYAFSWPHSQINVNPLRRECIGLAEVPLHIPSNDHTNESILTDIQAKHDKSPIQNYNMLK
jgi:hypothetical protein